MKHSVTTAEFIHILLIAYFNEAVKNALLGEFDIFGGKTESLLDLNLVY